MTTCATLTQPKRGTRLTAAVLLALTVAAILAFATVAPATADAGSGSRLDRVERKVLKKLNRIRAKAGLRSLRPNNRLNRSADYHSRDMLRANFFAHTSSNGDSMAARVRAYRRAKRLGEVLAYVPGRKPRRQARTVVRMWMNSSGHRASILTGGFRRVGIARRKGRLGSSRVVVFTVDFTSAR